MAALKIEGKLRVVLESIQLRVILRVSRSHRRPAKCDVAGRVSGDLRMTVNVVVLAQRIPLSIFPNLSVVQTI